MFSKPERILVVAVPRLGDVLLSMPVIHNLKSAYPDAKIDLLTRQGSQVILEGQDLINELITFNYKSTVKSYWQMVKKIYGKYDLAISTSTSDRSILSCFYAAPNRYSVIPAKSAIWKKVILSNYVRDSKDCNVYAQNMKLLNFIDLNKQKAEEQKQISFNTSAKFKLFADQSYVVVHCCSSQESKNISSDSWVKMIEDILKQNLKVVLTSGPDQKEIAYVQDVTDRISKLYTKDVFGPLVDLEFRELGDLLKNAFLYVGVDTCVSHLAAMLGTETVTVFRDSSILRWAPFPQGYTELEENPFNSKETFQRVCNSSIINTPKDNLSAEIHNNFNNLLIQLLHPTVEVNTQPRNFIQNLLKI